MQNVPLSLGFAFALTTALTLWLFYRAARPAGRTLSGWLAWLALQAGLGLSGFYAAPAGTGPPRLPLLLGPPLGWIVGRLLTARGRAWLDGLRLPALTLLHIVRVPVELVLLALYHYGAVPRLMTFEGRNWDVLAGLSAPLVYYLVFRRRALGPRFLLAWNVLSLLSLLNIVITALLSAPSSVQRFAFDQPNVAIQHFPYVWLPAVVVPLVLLAHLAAIRQLLRGAAAEA